ncbi:MAG: calcium/sodium antiporter [Alphaproteobacteria bacterium]|jgi:cation:H+ antiporter
MNLMMTIGGLALLLFGGEVLIRGAVGLAKRVGISPFIVGLTIIGFGTSAPEVVVSVDAALSGSPGIAVGNVIGSNIANILLIVGSAALFVPLAVHPDALKRDGTMMAFATVLFIAIALMGTATWYHGVVSIIVLVAYLTYSVWSDRQKNDATAQLHRDKGEQLQSGLPDKVWVMLLALGIGLAALVAGSRFAVIGASAIAREAGISEEVIGITLVAFGTSLPELATAMVAAARKQADVCIGNVIGSNIFNLLGITGAAAIAAPLPFAASVVSFDIWVLLAVTVLFLWFMLTGRRIQRWEGAVLLLLYFSYISLHFLPGGILPTSA